MIIESGNVAMTSRRSYERTTSVSSSLTRWDSQSVTSNNVTLINSYKEQSGAAPEETQTTVSDDQSSASENSSEDFLNEFKQAQSIGSSISITSAPSDIRKVRNESIQYLIMLLFGKKYVQDNRLLDKLTGQDSTLASQMESNSNVLGLQQSGGSYTESYSYSEKETTTFSTTGTVKTADGKEITFHLSLAMSRSFEEAYTSIRSFGAPLNNVCDPLVINLNTTSAHVTDQKFYFDLDADGSLDKISTLSSGSGFLAFDKNGDGVINDGTELFGTQNGDGFADLAAYDDDNNGWIDEADAIFDKLRIWTKDASGNDVLCAIGKAGIGAIYLGNEGTEFSLNSAKDNSANAFVRKTGIFLYENGGCGTIQHVDMVDAGA